MQLRITFTVVELLLTRRLKMEATSFSMAAVQGHLPNFTHIASVVSAWAGRHVEVLGNRDNMPSQCAMLSGLSSIVAGMATLKMGQSVWSSCLAHSAQSQKSLSGRVGYAVAGVLATVGLSVVAAIAIYDGYSRLQ